MDLRQFSSVLNPLIFIIGLPLNLPLAIFNFQLKNSGAKLPRFLSYHLINLFFGFLCPFNSTTNRPLCILNFQSKNLDFIRRLRLLRTRHRTVPCLAIPCVILFNQQFHYMIHSVIISYIVYLHFLTILRYKTTISCRYVISQ